GFFNLSSPYLIKGKIGLGISGQYFNTPLYSQTNFSLSASEKFFDVLSLGFKLNLFTKSYDREGFDLVDENDPVFARGTIKTAFSFGAGILVAPFPNFSIGLGLDHINRPRVSLGQGNLRQPLSLDGGIRYSLGTLTSLINLTYMEDELSSVFSVEHNISESAVLQLGYGMKALRFQGKFHLYKGISLEYGHEYPVADFWGTSFGSHRVCLIYQFDRMPNLPEISRPKELRLPFTIVQNKLELQPRFFVYSSVNTLEIVDKKITRIIEKGITANELSYLAAFELDFLDSSKVDTPSQFNTRPIEGFYPEVKFQGNFTKSYRNTLNKILNLMKEKNDLETYIITNVGASNRALGMYNYFLNNPNISKEQVKIVAPAYWGKPDSLVKVRQLTPESIPPIETLTVISHDSTVFHIVPIYFDDYQKDWSLRIFNSSGELIKQFKGQGKVPTEITWNWRKDDGEFIEPDLYYYRFQWRDAGDQIQQSNPRIIDVKKIKRELTVRITKEGRYLDKGVTRLGLRLNR
ncbi:MAG: type IX secretion system membrane protein PorP/SprF, partial [candidate division KSB1 bacterium]|nr:type IX secretion system membrane protein PorP/SprF [candidate division KSB1 bacterium]